MREHKYQAWHKKEKKMYIPNYLHFSPEGELFGVLVNEGQLLFIDDFELREYTGLKDNNGQEIYEGDILKAVRNEYGVKIDEVKEVKYDEYMQLMPLHDIVGYDAELWMDESTYEVIGNVYEHRHLIEGDQA